ncbi:uncharacterized protein LOC106643189 [Copidosoma floridanum]|uniref:uncharacterized protein LOC106643189 n=1 Tax=Copidosoma floridanum TaxID=29053 RepID=UPI0006C9C6D7|nr:uncharacterized protein LOC106643189 [Copidosoma floridanum]
MPVDLYYVPGSGPCRSVRMVAAAVGVELNLKLTDLTAKEQLKPEFIKMNPQHTVPTMNDNGFYLWESRAICTYLCDKYAKNDSLYPKDPKQRAVINQRLYFDMGTMYQSFADYYYPQVFGGAPADKDKLEKCNEALGYLENFLEGQNYVAGNSLTVADLVLTSSVSNFTIVDFDMSKFKNVTKWLARMEKEAPKYEETNGEGLKAFKALIDNLMKKMKLYYAPYSPPSRAILLTAEYIGVSLELCFIDIFKGEQLTSEFEEINPEKKVPFLVDEDFKLGESRAIMIYLVEKCGPDSGILPFDPEGRALVNLGLNFDIATLYKSITQYYFPVIFKMEEEYSPEKLEKLRDAFGVLDAMLGRQDYVAGRTLSVADLSIVSSVTTAEALGFEVDGYENVTKWIDRVKESTPGYEKINVEGVEMLKSIVDQVTQS